MKEGEKCERNKRVRTGFIANDIVNQKRKYIDGNEDREEQKMKSKVFRVLL